jgi:nicotinate phosphoribosyltransferase
MDVSEPTGPPSVSGRASAGSPGLLLDLYELTMAEAYVAARIHTREATFSLFARHVPPGWGFLVSAGLDDVLQFLEHFRFEPDDLAYLERTNRFSRRLLETLEELRFTGSVRAMPEGTVFFADEPVLEVTSSLIEAQLVETAVLNLVHFQSLVTAKATRCVEAARRRPLVDFGMRRTHGLEASIHAARGSFIAGFAATSNTAAGRAYDIPVSGTMAHSFIQAFPDERSAFRAFTEAYPQDAILLVDTYDTVTGTRAAAEVARELRSRGGGIRGIRLDSGDLGSLSREARHILDAAGLQDAIVFASGNLDEGAIAALVAEGASIDGFGVGTRMSVSADAPYCDMAYKLVSVGGEPTLKLSVGKATWPGPKQVWRTYASGRIARDVLAPASAPGPPGAVPLLESVMIDGRGLAHKSAAAARYRLARQVTSLPTACRGLDAAPLEVTMSDDLRSLRARVAERVWANGSIHATAAAG